MTTTMTMTRGMSSVVLLVVASLGVLHAQVAPSQFVPFKNFVRQTKAASSDTYSARSESRVQDAAAFEQMRQYILGM